MKKKLHIFYKGINVKAGGFLVNRLLPNDAVRSVGPIFLLDHAYPVDIRDKTSALPNGQFEHPHRGISTLTYVLSGNLSHYDSNGNHEIISSGGIHWLKSGSGIVHEEKPFIDKSEGTVFHAIHFWILLPSLQKKAAAEYKALQYDAIPEIELPNFAGVLRLLLGHLGSWSSPLKNFAGEFIYHIKLNPNSQFTFFIRKEFENAVFVPEKKIRVNNKAMENSKLIVLDRSQDMIFFENNNVTVADAFLFGGLPYKEPIVAEGPFVMNSHQEIAMAYRDFFNGKYGKIDYDNLQREEVFKISKLH